VKWLLIIAGLTCAAPVLLIAAKSAVSFAQVWLNRYRGPPLT
jgi:hypothetical protein